MSLVPRSRMVLWTGATAAAAAVGAWLIGGEERVSGAGFAAGLLLAASAPLGASALCLTHTLTGGRWGEALRPIAGPMAAMVWLLPLLSLPLLLMLEAYPWAHVPAGEHAEVLLHRRPWMSVSWTVGRGVVVLAVWAAVGTVAARGWRGGRRASKGAAGVGLVLLLVGVTFASIDWVLALHASFYSSIFGLTIFMAACVNALALIILVLLAAGRGGSGLPAQVLRDLSALLFAGLILDFYMAFSQFFISWNGNLPARVEWYEPRMAGPWMWLTVAMVLLRYLIPIALLTPGRLKRNRRAVALAAAIALAGGAVQAAWQALPSAGPPTLPIIGSAVLSSAALLALGAAVFFEFLRRSVGVSLPGELLDD